MLLIKLKWFLLLIGTKFDWSIYIDDIDNLILVTKRSYRGNFHHTSIVEYLISTRFLSLLVNGFY